MLSRDERVAILAEANRHRQQNKRESVEDALGAMLKTKSRVSISGVATKAGVSRNFVYSQHDLVARIREAAAGQSHLLYRHRDVSSTEANLRARLVAALDAVGEAKERITELEARVERLTGELVRATYGPPADC